jgi:peptidoglycan/LPS O-acetylase OafA/YrhL
MNDIANSPTDNSKRIDSLDGFRAIAIIAVIGSHASAMWPSVPWLINPVRDGGFIGVDMFFVLSGFLVTGLLIKEHESSGSVNLWKFFLRRGTRLIPPLLVFLVVSLVLAIHLKEDIRIFLTTAVSAVFYIANWAVVINLKRTPELGHLWSLSMEEQFYAAIAIVVYLYRRLVHLFSLQKFIVYVSLLIISWSVFAKIYILRTGDVGANWGNLYFRTDLRADAFFIGSLTAVFRQNQLTKPTKLIGATFIPSMIWLVTYMISTNLDYAFNYRGGLTIVAIASAFVILAASYPETLADKLLSSRALKSLGLISYSVYLIHVPVFNALSPNNTSMSYQYRFLIAFFGILIYSIASYFLLEKPLAKVRRRFLS